MTNKVLKSSSKGRSTGRAIIQMTTFVLNYHRARRFPDNEKYTEISRCFLRKGLFFQGKQALHGTRRRKKYC